VGLVGGGKEGGVGCARSGECKGAACLVTVLCPHIAACTHDGCGTRVQPRERRCSAALYSTHQKMHQSSGTDSLERVGDRPSSCVLHDALVKRTAAARLYCTAPWPQTPQHIQGQGESDASHRADLRPDQGPSFERHVHFYVFGCCFNTIEPCRICERVKKRPKMVLEADEKHGAMPV